MKLCSWLAAWVLLVHTAGPRPACAQRMDTSVALELSWHAPPECPRAAEIRERVRALSGPKAASASSLQADVTIERTPDGGFQLLVMLRAGDSRGQRRLTGQSCDELAEALVVHIALLLQAAEPVLEHAPEAVSGVNSAAEHVSLPATDELATHEPVSDAGRSAGPQGRVQRTGSSERRIQFLLQLPVAVLGLGLLPQPALGLAAAGGVRLERWQWLIDGQLWPGQVVTGADQPTVSAELERISAGAQTCYALLDARVALAPCVRVGVEHVWGRGSGANVAARTAHATWVAGGIGAQLRYQALPWLGFVAACYVQVESTRIRVQLVDEGELAKLGLAAVTFSLGSEWIL